jgi:hypothetical protein
LLFFCGCQYILSAYFWPIYWLMLFIIYWNLYIFKLKLLNFNNKSNFPKLKLLNFIISTIFNSWKLYFPKHKSTHWQSKPTICYSSLKKSIENHYCWILIFPCNIVMNQLCSQCEIASNFKPTPSIHILTKQLNLYYICSFLLLFFIFRISESLTDLVLL